MKIKDYIEFFCKENKKREFLFFTGFNSFFIECFVDYLPGTDLFNGESILHFYEGNNKQNSILIAVKDISRIEPTTTGYAIKFNKFAEMR